MKKCNSCNNQVQDNFNFCPSCGGTNFIFLNEGIDNNQEVSGNPTLNLVQQSPQQNFNQQTNNNNESLTQNIEQPKKMTMGFAYFFIILLAFSTVSNCVALFDNFDIVTFVVMIFDVATIVFLIMRKKLGRLLAMINCVISAVFGIINIIMVINELNANGNSSVNALGVVIALVIILGWNLLAFNYFRVRKCMYTK